MITIKCTSVINMHKKHNFIAFVYIGTRWVKPVLPTEPILLITALLMWALQGDADRAGYLFIKIRTIYVIS